MTLQSLIDKPITSGDMPKRLPLRRVGNVMAACALVACELAFGVGTQPAAALPLEDLPTPLMNELRLDGTVAYVTYTDYSEDETGYLIRFEERDNRDRTWDNANAPGAPGTGRTVTYSVDGIPAGVALCARVQAWRTELIGASSGVSNTICADPAAAPLDLALDNIKGNAAPKANASPAYLVALRNAGGVDATGVVVDVSTSGVATLGDQGAVLGGWQASGFSCALQAPSGGQTAALRCTGGNSRPVSRPTPP